MKIGLTRPLEEEDNTWLLDRWEAGHRMKSKRYWDNMSNHCHCIAMALWDQNPTQRSEYMVLSALAMQLSMDTEEN